MKQAVAKIAELHARARSISSSSRHEHWDHVSGYVLAADALKTQADLQAPLGGVDREATATRSPTRCGRSSRRPRPPSRGLPGRRRPEGRRRHQRSAPAGPGWHPRLLRPWAPRGKVVAPSPTRWRCRTSSSTEDINPGAVDYLRPGACLDAPGSLRRRSGHPGFRARPALRSRQAQAPRSQHEGRRGLREEEGRPPGRRLQLVVDGERDERRRWNWPGVAGDQDEVRCRRLRSRSTRS